MIKYLGREYKSVAEIKERNKLGNIEFYKELYKAWLSNPTMEGNNVLCDHANRLVSYFGMTYDEIEALEIEVIQAV